MLPSGEPRICMRGGCNTRVMNKINILLLAKSVDGGTGTYLLNLLKLENKYKKLRFNIKTLVLEKPSYRSPKIFQADYFTNENSYPRYYRLTLKNVTRFYGELTWLRQKISNFKPQIVLSIDAYSNILAILSKIIWFKKVKLIVTTHIDLLKTLLNKSSPLLKSILVCAINIFYIQADMLVGVSKGVSKNLKRDFFLRKKVITIYNGIDNGIEISTKFIKHRTQAVNKIIITVTRLDDQKDIENLIDAFQLLQRQLPTSKLWILGDGPKRGDLELLVKKHKLQEKVYFLGWKNNIDKYLVKADLFMLSSKREGMPYAMIEAMRYGLPVVSTDVPYGPQEILDGGKYGILVPPRRPDIMHKIMYKLLTNSIKYVYFSRKSIERSRFFSIDKMLGKYSDLFISLSTK